MNDEFLYQLRKQPTRQFANRLKARLDSQALEREARHRRRVWLITIAAFLTGGVAFAVVTPSVRNAAWAWIHSSDVESPETGMSRPPSAERTVNANVPPIDRSATIHATLLPADETPEREEEPQRATTHDRPQIVSGTTAPSNSPSTVIAVQGPALPQPSLIVASDYFVKPLEEAITKGFQQATVAHVGGDEIGCGRRQTVRSREIDLILTAVRREEALKACRSSLAEYREFIIAYEAVALIVHRENTWTKAITVDDLRRMVTKRPFDPLQTWNQIRPEWPTLPFTVIGTDMQTRTAQVLRSVVSDVEPALGLVQADDSGVIREVERNFGSIGVISLRALPPQYARRNVVEIANAQGESVYPLRTLVGDGRYPLARPIYGYLNVNSLQRRVAMAYVMSGFEQHELLSAAGYVPVSEAKRAEVRRLLEEYRYR